jgi:hypothetical protein
LGWNKEEIFQFHQLALNETIQYPPISLETIRFLKKICRVSIKIFFLFLKIIFNITISKSFENIIKKH